MAKDPFKNVPVLETEDDTPQGQSSAATKPEAIAISKGNAPRNMLANLQKWAMIGITLGLLIWVMIPTTGTQKRKPAPETPVEIDATKQISDTNNLMETLKNQAKQAPSPVPVVAQQNAPVLDSTGKDVFTGNPPVDPALQANGTGTQPAMAPVTALPARSLFNMNQPDGSAEGDDAIAKAKRLEEIRGAPLQVQGMKLRTTSNDTPTTPKLTALQEELAAVSARRDIAAQAQTELMSRGVGANTQPQEQRGSRLASEEFLAREGASGTTRKVLQVQPPVARMMVQENTAIRAVLLSGVSSDLPGKISAMVTSDVYDSIYRRYVLIPKGSTLIGVYSSEVVVGQEALLIAMTRLILPNGNWIALGGAPVTNMIGRSGMTADVNNHFWKMFGSSFVIGASSLLLPKQQNTVSTTSTGAGTVTTGSAAALAMSDALSNMMSRNKSMAPTLTATSGAEFMFLVSQDMAMTPYKP